MNCEISFTQGWRKTWCKSGASAAGIRLVKRLAGPTGPKGLCTNETRFCYTSAWSSSPQNCILPSFAEKRSHKVQSNLITLLLFKVAFTGEARIMLLKIVRKAKIFPTNTWKKPQDYIWQYFSNREGHWKVSEPHGSSLFSLTLKPVTKPSSFFIRGETYSPTEISVHLQEPTLITLENTSYSHISVLMSITLSDYLHHLVWS